MLTVYTSFETKSIYKVIEVVRDDICENLLFTPSRCTTGSSDSHGVKFTINPV
jgi:hypothetical protein